MQKTHIVIDNESHCEYVNDDGQSIPNPFSDLHDNRFVPNGPVSSVDEECIWTALNGGCNVLISGKGGSGKTHLLHRFIAHTANNDTIRLAITAPTAIAAWNISGETIHRKLGLGLANEDPIALWKKIVAKPRVYQRTWTFLEKTDVLIIDEVSMLHPDLFRTLEFLFRKARLSLMEQGQLASHLAKGPFGGVRLLCVGDFLQLGAIEKDNRSIPHLFDTELWDTLPLCRIWLERSFRQREGDPFLDVLNHVRVGNLSASDYALLQTRMIKHKEEKQRENLCIYSYKNEVQQLNESKLQAMVKGGAQLHHFPAKVAPRAINPKSYSRADFAEALEMVEKPDNWPKQFPVVDVDLCIGARVMCKANLFPSMGICNGSVGEVLKIHDESIEVEFQIRDTFKTVFVPRFEFTFKVGSVNLVNRQFPLCLSWAATIHAVQGSTLERVEVGSKGFFACGQVYTALSRVRELKDLHLVEFNPQSIKADPKAVMFETCPTAKREMNGSQCKKRRKQTENSDNDESDETSSESD